MIDANAAGFVKVSVVIPVRDRWSELEECLTALEAQRASPVFEVIVVDDGSASAAPERLARKPFSFLLTLKRTPPRGIGAARNAGVRIATGELLVFIDSDCLAGDCFLEAAWEVSNSHPADVGFQANLRGSERDIVGIMEGLRLESVIEQKRRADGRVDYLNTSGFALRKSFVPADGQLFAEDVSRGEDSLLLADLLERNAPPRLLDAGIVNHGPRISLFAYITKHFRIGYQTETARARLNQGEVAVLTSTGRRQMFRAMWTRAKARRGGSAIFVLVMLAYGLERFGRVASNISSRGSSMSRAS